MKKKLTFLTDMSKDLHIIPADMPRNLQINLTDMPENLQIIIRFFRFSPIFYPNLSDFLRISLNFSDFSPNFSDFLRISLIFSDFPDFSSYLCTRKSAARKKDCGVIIFKKY